MKITHRGVWLALAFVLSIAGLSFGSAVPTAQANDIQPFQIIANTDVVSVGYGGMRNVGSGTLQVSGVSGSVTKAYLYWHGPTNTTDPSANASVRFAGATVEGANIGFSSDNCWEFTNSQAYRADVTALITGNGSYSLANFTKPNAQINGVSLIIFFDDGNVANNRDIVLFDGNDSNTNNIYDASGWNVTLPGINYGTGSASIAVHVSDGQRATGSSSFNDPALVLNGSTLAGTGQIFAGDSVPNGSSDGPINGGLWDIKSFDITSALTPGNNTLTLTARETGRGEDCLSLIIAAINLPAGAAPPTLPSGPTPPVTEAPLGQPAFVTVVNRPTPNTTATRGGVITYNIVATNRGKGRAKDVIIEAPFNPSEVTLLDVTFTGTTAAWVSEVRREGLTIRTGPISGNNTSITATMRVLVNADVANGTDLSERLSFTWRDSAKGGASTSNITGITVGDSAVNVPTYSFAVAPASGPLSATRSFETGIYAPSEPVALWISTPDGRNIPIYELDSDDQLNAEDDGSLAVNVDLSDFDPGTYSIVTYGTWTEFTATGVFVIQ